MVLPLQERGKKITSLGNPNQSASDAGNASIKARARQVCFKGFASSSKTKLGQGKSMKEVAVYLNQEGYQTSRGGDWYASTGK